MNKYSWTWIISYKLARFSRTLVPTRIVLNKGIVRDFFIVISEGLWHQCQQTVEGHTKMGASNFLNRWDTEPFFGFFTESLAPWIMEIHGRESPLRIVGSCGLDNICLSHISTTPGIGHCSQEQKKSEITLLPKQKPKLSAMKTKKASEVYLQLLLSRKIKVLQKAVRKIQDLQTTNGTSNMNLNQKPVQGNMLQLVPCILSSSMLWLGII